MMTRVVEYPLKICITFACSGFVEVEKRAKFISTL